MTDVMVPVHIEELPEGGFLAASENLLGLVTQGRTVAKTLEIAQDVACKLVESYLEHGDKLPDILQGSPHTSVELQIPVSIG